MWSLLPVSEGGGGASVGSGSWGTTTGAQSGSWSFAPAPAPAPSYVAPSYVAPSFSFAAPASGGGYMPLLVSAPAAGYALGPGGDSFVGPYGEGDFTPINYPAMRFLGRYESLGRRRGQAQGVVSSDRDLLIKLGIGLAILALLK